MHGGWRGVPTTLSFGQAGTNVGWGVAPMQVPSTASLLSGRHRRRSGHISANQMGRNPTKAPLNHRSDLDVPISQVRISDVVRLLVCLLGAPQISRHFEAQGQVVVSDGEDRPQRGEAGAAP